MGKSEKRRTKKKQSNKQDFVRRCNVNSKKQRGQKTEGALQIETQLAIREGGILLKFCFPSIMEAMSIEQIDQEITLHLQSIDSDLSYCFNKITKDVIPYVTRYGQTCEEITNSSAWLKEMFQQSANVQLVTDQSVESAGQVLEPRASLFPKVDHGTDEFHTAQLLGVAGTGNANDDKDTNRGQFQDQDTEEMTLDSAIEKQRKKRKISLQIHQQFNSSSSASSNSSMEKDISANSSPIRMIAADAETGTETNNKIQGQLANPRTVIHFNSKRD
ncbi:unnamed protein product [Kluyveromyces dobzhanskii CBS 2104]|uniref:DASH complex subunit ASK1 n=1 Tax=Kluyveromyces dobzhanskii CBS 2104 TaxID=1427455 RepID=A0A0A8L913_9SACH|nr:unnamed protein product [Kluyveromyces dobzhanskii CBS 2104]